MSALPDNLHRDTLAVRAGIERSQYGEHSETMYLTSSFIQPDAATAARRFAQEGYVALAPGAVLGWDKNTFSRLLKYAMSCWLGMLIQYSMTLLLSLYIYYLLANVVSILLASVSNYLTNDWWTFRQKPVHPTE